MSHAGQLRPDHRAKTACDLWEQSAGARAQQPLLVTGDPLKGQLSLEALGSTVAAAFEPCSSSLRSCSAPSLTGCSRACRSGGQLGGQSWYLALTSHKPAARGGSVLSQGHVIAEVVAALALERACFVAWLSPSICDQGLDELRIALGIVGRPLLAGEPRLSGRGGAARERDRHQLAQVWSDFSQRVSGSPLERSQRLQRQVDLVESGASAGMLEEVGRFPAHTS